MAYAADHVCSWTMSEYDIPHIYMCCCSPSTTPWLHGSTCSLFSADVVFVSHDSLVHCHCSLLCFSPTVRRHQCALWVYHHAFFGAKQWSAVPPCHAQSVHALLTILLDKSFAQLSILLPSLACVKWRHLHCGCNMDLVVLWSLSDYAGGWILFWEGAATAPWTHIDWAGDTQHYLPVLSSNQKTSQN